MRKTVGSEQLAVASKNPPGFELLRSMVSPVLVALLVLATVISSSTLSALAQRRAKSKGTQTEQLPKTDAGQLGNERRAPETGVSLVTEFDVNGLKVLVKRRAGSQTVAAALFLRGGSRNLTPDNAGIESLMLDVATQASDSFPRERLRSELARTGTVISSAENYDYSVMALICTRPNFDRAWQLFADVALHPTFAKADFELVKNRKLSSLRDDSDDPDTYLQRLQERVAYVGHPYLNRPHGTVDSVSRLTLEDVPRYHQQMMETSRLLLVIVGDLDPAQLRAGIAASFGKLPRGNYRSEPVPELSFGASTVDVTQRGLPTNYVQGLFAAPSLTATDIYPMQVASSVLRERVFEEVRVKRNLSYAPNAFLGSQSANVGGIYVTAVDANQAVRVMLDQIRRLQSQPLQPIDITAVVSQYLTSYYMGQETNAAQAASLAEYELIGGGWRNSFDTLTRLRAVTPADVQRVAQKYMRNLRFVVLGDPNRVDKAIFTSQAGE